MGLINRNHTFFILRNELTPEIMSLGVTRSVITKDEKAGTLLGKGEGWDGVRKERICLEIL